MLHKVLNFVDKYIHKVIPHPPCDKLHYVPPTINWASINTSSTYPGHVHWTYKT